MNKRSRSSYFLADHAVVNLVNAAEHAIRIGCPLNRFLTIHLDKGEIRRDQVSAFRTRFGKLASDWLGSTPWCAIWVMENPPGGGLNIHELIHVPESDQQKFSKLYISWLRRAGLQNIKGAKKLQSISGADAESYATRSPRDGRRYIDNLNVLLRYVLKGSTDQARKALKIGYEEKKNQGRIEGKRSGVSEALGRTARHRFAAEIARKRRARPWYVIPPLILVEVWPWDRGEER